jgi:hypothetical protein
MTRTHKVLTVGAATAIAIGLILSLTAAWPSFAQDMTFVGDLRQIGTNTLNGSKPLRQLLATPHTYGLGMVAGLEGELLVIDSNAKLGRFKDGAYAILEPMEDLVAFGAFATVPNWQSLPIPLDVKSFKDLETYIAGQIARLHPGRVIATPFRLVGTAQSLKWFVVGGMGDLKPTPRESFVAQLKRGVLQDRAISAFGFYNPGPRGITTNPASSMHAHFETTSGPPFVGHIDDEIVFAPGAELLLPAK